jgi:hypothetical protein
VDAAEAGCRLALDVMGLSKLGYEFEVSWSDMHALDDTCGGGSALPAASRRAVLCGACF